ncbi:hypothetical protein ACEPAI_8694 [Sanghuangporus weigelae]
MFQDDVDADYVVVGDDEIDVDYPYPWDNDPEPETPVRRPNPHDPIEPRRRRDRIRGRVPLTRNYDGSLTLPGDIKDGSSQETQDDHPLRIPQRELLSNPLHSDGLSGYPRYFQSDPPLRNATTTPRRNRRAHMAKETPLALRETTNKHAMHPNKAEDKHLRNADDGIRVLIGPMPVEEFLDEFLPAVDESEMPDPTGAFDTVPAKAHHETHIYPPLIAAINENGRCPGLTFVDTSVTSEQSGRGVSKPDVTAYNEGDVSLLKQVCSKTSNAIHTCANLGIAETFFEVKPDDQDPLKDDHEENESFFDWENYKIDSRKREKKKKAFGQNVSYASEGCALKKEDGSIEKVEIGFLKDVWRIDLPGLTSEGEILSDMGQKKVPNIPELDCFGDVPDEDTDFLDSESDSGDSAREIGEGEPVIEASEEPQTTRTQEFIHEEWDVLEALVVAYEKEGKAGDYYRSGTWAYMSTNALLRKPGFRHSHQDDLESLFYVSLYCAVLWLPHNIKKKLGTWMFNFFDYSSLDDEQPSGGDKKRTYKYNPSKFTTEFLFKNDHIKAWFSNAYADLATYAEENVKGRLALTTWTSEDVWRHMRAICNGISKGRQTGVERVAHSVADKFIPGASYYWATRVSTSIITGSRVSESSQPQSERGSKRSMTETEGPYEEPQPENKRSRLSIRNSSSGHLP